MFIIKSLLRVVYQFVTRARIGSYKTKPRVNGFTLLSKKTHIGTNVNFNGFRVYGNGNVTIGDNFHSGSGCFIITQVHNYHGDSIPYDSSYLFKNVIIEDNVWFGMNVSVLSGCTIGEGAIIQAGSVIVTDIPKLSIAGGNPAKVFKYRDKEHYHNLKKLGKFH
ncbi:acyltransferase [Shewanella japonica]|uniref:acyltransferase n=1 Tax=Shewanella japonica TaxID=93973 RepID=UPI0013C48FDC|nr:acyltransferase [Shewanella japonica]